MYDEQFGITWDENDVIQAPEDEWISSVIGSNEEVIEQFYYEGQS